MENVYEQPRFGVAGFPPAFFESPYKKKRSNIFEWLDSLDLNWVELQNTYGVKMKEDQAIEYRKSAEKYNIGISLHAPYYITLASADADVVSRSTERIFQCLNLAQIIGANRIIFHPGHFPGDTLDDRQRGVKKIIDGLLGIKHDIPKGIYLYAETAGKKSQIGSVEEIVEICSHVDYVKPCLDLAHIHGFNDGSLKSADSIEKVIDYVGKRLGEKVLRDIHFHMYPVEINKNGEKKHRSFQDRMENYQTNLFNDLDETCFFPRPDDFVTALKKKRITPVVVCEALNSQEHGARLMKQLYETGGEASA